MVSVAMSSLGASNIHVLEPRVKINGAYYRDIPAAVRLQHTKDTVALLDQEMPDFHPTRCLAA